jgi:hypothetical protein
MDQWRDCKSLAQHAIEKRVERETRITIIQRSYSNQGQSYSNHIATYNITYRHTTSHVRRYHPHAPEVTAGTKRKRGQIATSVTSVTSVVVAKNEYMLASAGAANGVRNRTIWPTFPPPPPPPPPPHIFPPFHSSSPPTSHPPLPPLPPTPPPPPPPHPLFLFPLEHFLRSRW